MFGFEEGLKLVAARGRYMQDAAVARLCAEAAGGEVLVAANYNAPGQIVVSGSSGACERVLRAAEAAGFKSAALKVAGAFHSPIMQPGADKMKAELDRVVFRPAAKPVYSNVTAAPHADGDSIKRLLVDQIVSPVLWEDTMVKLIGAGEARFLELAPGRTLAGLAKRINRRLPIESIAELVGAAAKAS